MAKFLYRLFLNLIVWNVGNCFSILLVDIVIFQVEWKLAQNSTDRYQLQQYIFNVFVFTSINHYFGIYTLSFQNFLERMLESVNKHNNNVPVHYCFTKSFLSCIWNYIFNIILFPKTFLSVCLPISVLSHLPNGNKLNVEMTSHILYSQPPPHN